MSNSYKRNYPYGSEKCIAMGHRLWNKYFNPEKKVVLYLPINANSYSVISYHESVSAANDAAESTTVDGVHPRIAINFWHSSITKAKSTGPHPTRDATTAFPSWYDEAPRY